MVRWVAQTGWFKELVKGGVNTLGEDKGKKQWRFAEGQKDECEIERKRSNLEQRKVKQTIKGNYVVSQKITGKLLCVFLGGGGVTGNGTISLPLPFVFTLNGVKVIKWLNGIKTVDESVKFIGHVMSCPWIYFDFLN